MYGLKLLKAHGLRGLEISRVTEAILLPILTYASPAWWGFLNVEEKTRLNAILLRTHKWGLINEIKIIATLVGDLDIKLFSNILGNPAHCLHHMLPPVRQTTYNLRQRPHNRTLPATSTLLKKNFLNRMLYKDSY